MTEAAQEELRRGLKEEAPVFANQEEFPVFSGYMAMDRRKPPCSHVECPLLGCPHTNNHALTTMQRGGIQSEEASWENEMKP